MFGRKHNFDFGEVGIMAMFTVTANLAKKLNIPAKEFVELMHDMDGAHEYLREIIESQKERL